MYPTLNISLFARPGTATGGETQAMPLLQGAEVVLADSFQASLARNLGAAVEGGNPLPADGTALPGAVLMASAAADVPVLEGAPVEALPTEGLQVGVALPEPIVPDTVELSIPGAPLEAAVQPEAQPGAFAAGMLPATEPATDTTQVGIRPTPALPGASGVQATQQRGQTLPFSASQTAADPVPADRTAVASFDARVGAESGSRFDEVAMGAARPAPEARELSAQRPDLATNPVGTPAERVRDHRSVTAPSLPPLEPAAALAAQARPAVNVATPVQAVNLQSAAVDVPIQAPVGEPGFDDAIADRVWVMTQARLGNAEIRLTPAELGPVRIQVSVDDGTASVTFQAAHAATREAIEQALPRLRELLAENGLSLGQANVGDDGVRDGNREATEQSGSANVADDAGEDLDGDTGTVDARRTGRAGRALVDTFA